MTRRVSILPLVALLMLPACASAPPPAPPVVTWEQKLADIVRLEDSRTLRDVPPPVAPVVATGRRRGPVVLPPPPPDLVAMLGDGEGRVRRRAALAIGRVGLAEGVEPLARLLAGDGDAEVREMAAFALGILGDAAAVAPLRTALADPAVLVQGRAAEALGLLNAVEASGEIGTLVARYATAAAVGAMAADDVSSVVAPEAEAFRLGVYALTRLKAWEPFRAAVLDERGLPRIRWWPVAYALGRMERTEALPALRWWLQHTDTEGVAFALRGVGALKDQESVDALLSFVDPATRPVRHVAQAIRSLGQIGAARAAARLEAVLLERDLDQNLRIETLEALAALRAREALDVVLDHLLHPAPVVRGAALRAAAAIDAEGFVPVLSGLDADPAWSVRRDLASALAALPLELAAPRLSLLVKDDDPRVVAVALESLSKLDAPGSEAALIAALEHASITVRTAAAGELGRRKAEAAAAALAAAWTRGASDEDFEARIAALEALVVVAPNQARPLLQAAAADPDWAVRRRAATIARGLTPPSDVPAERPAATRRANADYGAASIVAPSYSPHAYVDTAKGTIEIELAVLDAPLTVANFMSLAADGFFNGMAIHRVVPNFVVQTGDNRGDGSGGPGYTIRDELNPRPYLRGTVGMALAGPDTGGSQWFITHGPQPHLDARYTVFGRVVAGMDIVDRLARGDTIERVRIWDGTAWQGR